MSEAKPTPNPSVDRRSNTVLRELIDAMLERVREAQRNAETWSPGERRNAEQDLASIMERVKQQATLPPGVPPSTPAAGSERGPKADTPSKSAKATKTPKKRSG